MGASPVLCELREGCKKPDPGVLERPWLQLQSWNLDKLAGALAFEAGEVTKEESNNPFNERLRV
jgi:hypothetical protein